MKASTIIMVTSKSLDMNTSTGYIIGAFIALLIFGYLLFTLIRPEKF